VEWQDSGNITVKKKLLLLEERMLRFYILIQSLASLSGGDLILSRSLNIYTHGILTKLFKGNLPVGTW
jgi:hypothetical protein